MPVGSFVTVLFEVPRTVATGLASGQMIRRGGVIQRATGDAKGEVVMWLKESGALARLGAEVPAPVTQQLAQLQMATSALAIGQAVSLGFSVLSFAVLNHKLNVLGRKVDQVLAEIADLKEEVGWLDRRQDLALEARLRGALDQCHYALATGRVEAFVAQRGTLVEVEHHYRGLLAAMLEHRRAHRHAALFATYQGHLALSGVARVRCEAVLDGLERGVAALEAVQSDVCCVSGTAPQPR